MKIIDRIIITQDRKQAIIVFNYDRANYTLHCSKGQVLLLLDFILAPIGFKSYLEYCRRLIASQEDTQEIEVNNYTKAG